jgi:hypothetical protein
MKIIFPIQLEWDISTDKNKVVVSENEQATNRDKWNSEGHGSPSPAHLELCHTGKKRKASSIL